jgi:dipeptidyl aminopeptidase/acylaminoacyl peptidase
VIATDKARIQRLLSVARATRPVAADDGSLFYSSNRGGHAQVYRQKAPGEEPELIYASDTRMVPHEVTPHGLLVREDRGGNEIWQLAIVDDGKHRPLTDDAKAIHHAATAFGGRRLGLSWNPGGQADLVLGELDLVTGEMTRWAEPGGFWRWTAWGPDGERALVMKVMGTPAEGYVLERGGALTCMLSRARRVIPLAWTEQGIIAATDLDRDFLGLALIDPANLDEVSRWLVDEAHEVEGAVLDHDEGKVAVVVNEGIFDVVRIVGLDGHVSRVQLPPGVVITDHSGDAGYHLGWSTDGSRLFISWERPTLPAEIYEWPGGARWTHTNDLPEGLVEPLETSYRSFDGLEVPSMVYRVDQRPRPAVVEFHGGPEGQWRGGYVPAAQMLTAIGVNVLMPNVRGSTGYGMRYQSLDDKTLRWNAVRDGSEAARHLKASGMATKVAAMGGSYGGFMTLAVLVDDPELWDAAVDVVGIADWHTFFRNMPPWRGVLRRSEYGDPNGEEAEFLRNISPIHRASTIKAPLLVIHGRNDPRVPVGESIQIAEAVKESELLIFEDEGHGVAKLGNQVTANSKILEFLAAHLLEGG